MYHDQGHIPMKLLDFEHTVNISLGLPIIRTSVDHGTAFDIAGKNQADATQHENGDETGGYDGGPHRQPGLALSCHQGDISITA